jgi:choline dehydrogenase-like flavoprotein
VAETYDVIIIGTGACGGAPARHPAPSGTRILPIAGTNDRPSPGDHGAPSRRECID